jgi:hypothetical protein
VADWSIVLPLYLYCGLHVESNVTIPELSEVENEACQMLVQVESAAVDSEEGFWLHHWIAPGGDKLFSYRKEASGHWLRFAHLANFQISGGATEISCYPVGEIHQEAIRHILLDQVLPRCLAHQGQIMLHASAVRMEHGLVLFVGDSGSGKSTLAGNFQQYHNPVVADDCVWVSENSSSIMAAPNYRSLRLWEDSLQSLFFADEKTTNLAQFLSKKRVPLEQNAVLGSEGSLPVLAVIVLTPSEAVREVKLVRLPHREAFIAMLKQTFQLNPTDIERMTRHMKALGRIVPRLKAFQLSLPHDYSLLPLVRQKILEALT